MRILGSDNGKGSNRGTLILVLIALVASLFVFAPLRSALMGWLRALDISALVTAILGLLQELSSFAGMIWNDAKCLVASSVDACGSALGFLGFLVLVVGIVIAVVLIRRMLLRIWVNFPGALCNFWKRIKDVADSNWRTFLLFIKPWIDRHEPSSIFCRWVKRRFCIAKKPKLILQIRSLAPADDVDESSIEVYSAALTDALKCHGIKNIAISGRFGAGKSSFLRTYFKGVNVLWISLASFIEEIKEDSLKGIKRMSEKDVRLEEEKLVRRLEWSILQQLFYTANRKELPFSRFKRIAVVSPISSFFWAIGILGTFLSVWCFCQPLRFAKFYKSFTEVFCQNLHFWSLFCLSVILFVFGCIAHRLVCRYRPNVGVSLKGVDIDISRSSNTSVFNRVMDEIVYYFEELKYEAVIFEDIDRLNKPIVFSKLREINQILNESRQIPKCNKPIRFIYALRDDVFGMEQRVKFFDFILPIIPLMSWSNSRAVFTTSLMSVLGVSSLPKEYERFVRRLSPYICDMRLLNNICNEFMVYQQRLSPQLPGSKVLGMIVFKNFFAKDFDELHENSGILRRLINLRDAIINGHVKQLNDRVDGLMAERRDFRKNVPDSLEALNQLYASEGLRSVFPKDVAEDELIVDVDGSTYSVSHFLAVEHFEELVGKSFTLRDGPYGRDVKDVVWADIEAAVGGWPYQKRKDNLSRTDQLKVFDQEITQCKQDIKVWRRKLLRDLLSLGDLKMEKLYEMLGFEYDTNGREYVRKPTALARYDLAQAGVLFVLLAEGYLTEYYRLYMSVFDEVIIKRSDYDFEMSVFKGIQLPNDYRISKVAEVVSDIAPAYFTTGAVLNFDLVTYLIRNGESKDEGMIDRLDALAVALFGHETIEFKFLDEIFSRNQQDHEFLRKLFRYINRHCSGYFQKMLESDLSDERKRAQLTVSLGLTHGRLSRVSEGAAKYLSKIEKVAGFFASAGLKREEIREFLTKFKIEFSRVDFGEKGMSELIDILLDTKSYEINSHMLMGLLRQKGISVLEWRRRGGSIIFNSMIVPLVERIKQNIEVYLENVYFAFKELQKDSWSFVEFVLNSTEVSVEKCREFLSRQENRIDDVTLLKYPDVADYAMQDDKVAATWTNIVGFYGKFVLEANPQPTSNGWRLTAEDARTTLAQYIIRNNVEIGRNRCPDGLKDIEPFADFLVNETRIHDRVVVKLLHKCRSYIKNLKYSNTITISRISELLEKKLISFDVLRFDELKSAGTGTHIVLIAKAFDCFFEHIDEIDLSDTDLLEVLRCDMLSIGNKKKLIARLEARILESTDLCEAAVKDVGTMDFKDYPSKVVCNGFDALSPASVQCAVLTGLNFNKENILKGLRLMPGGFAKLAVPGSRPLLPRTQQVESLLQLLKTHNIVSSYSYEGDDIRANTRKQ